MKLNLIRKRKKNTQTHQTQKMNLHINKDIIRSEVNKFTLKGSSISIKDIIQYS